MKLEQRLVPRHEPRAAARRPMMHRRCSTNPSSSLQHQPIIVVAAPTNHRRCSINPSSSLQHQPITANRQLQHTRSVVLPDGNACASFDLVACQHPDLDACITQHLQCVFDTVLQSVLHTLTSEGQPSSIYLLYLLVCVVDTVLQSVHTVH